MKRDLRSKLEDLRISGEVRSGRELAEAQRNYRNEELFPGEEREEETFYGRCYLREIKFSLNHQHGNSKLSGMLCCNGSDLILPSLDQALDDFSPQKALFLDIETTGLSGGTGTWAFLIGIGWLENNHFVLRQYFLRKPAEEKAILSHFAEMAAGYPILITFNGKMFDLPLIQTRQLISGLNKTIPSKHLDLLQCARVLWKKRLASRSLRSIEETLLDLRRFNDIPGAEIPGVYFDYLRRGNTGTLKQVFQHNVLDILSMATLLERVALTAAGKKIEHPAEALVLGQLCLRSGRTKEGLAFLYQASKENRSQHAEEAELELSFYFKKQDQWLEAVDIWEKAVRRQSINPVFYLELAKHYEHRCHKYEDALKLTERALELNSYHVNIPLSSQLHRSALIHRRQRLKRRLAIAKELDR